MKVNFHMHSNVSDGKLSPNQLIELAKNNQVKICSLTDHDSIDGLEEGKRIADKYSIRFINGIEISCHLNNLKIDFIEPHEDSIHLLGLNFDKEILKQIYIDRKDEKIKRIQNLVINLNNNGYDIQLPLLTDRKMLVAEKLVDKGYATNIQEAFENIINNYYSKYTDKMSVSEAIKMVHKAGGKIIWAHPFEIIKSITKWSINEEQVEKLCKIFKLLGLDGIEVHYQHYDQNKRNYLDSLKNKFDFISSFGTDYHGKKKNEKISIEADKKSIEVLLS